MPATRSWVTRWVNYKRYLCFARCRKPMSRRASIMSTCSSDPSRGPVRSHLLRKAKKKSLRMSFVIVLAFMICWTPYHIIFICTTIFDMIIDPIIFNYFSFIGLSNSMLNPVIYGAFQLCKVQFYSSRFVPRRPGTPRRCSSIVLPLTTTSEPTQSVAAVKKP
ncbi:hypothetical protein RRG08_051332 [Elysia crispata]|uniref:G-protein coupled receptors family 1 profile domain-containing protein n=1 Tax=Elysia crispata TaxID=231223 RepID=A0AAE1E984_9GAST|nr:hypothetical protein RRG08_051332 [Elysia crispata]